LTLWLGFLAFSGKSIGQLHQNWLWVYEPLLFAVAFGVFTVWGRRIDFHAVLIRMGVRTDGKAPDASTAHAGPSRFTIRLHHKSAVSILVIVLLSALIYSAVCLPPTPRIHDEFSYLLAADTFASGRWTNPAHALWQHFETYHVLQQPTYQSKYLPLHGAVLALGKTLTGYFLAGSWLELIAGALATYWALCAVTSIPLALIATLAVSLKIAFTPMASGYMGCFAFCAGALLIGVALRWESIARTGRRMPLAVSMLFAISLAILLHTRPYESAFFTLPLLGWILLHGFRHKRHRDLVKTGLIAVITLAAALSALGLYNAKVTGNAFSFPYVLHDQQYLRDPVVLWASGYPEVTYRHQEMERTYEMFSKRVLRVAWQTENILQFGVATLGKWLLLWKYLGGVALTVLAIAGIRTTHPAILVACVSFIVGLSTITYALPYYAVGGYTLFAVLAVRGLDRLIGQGSPTSQSGQSKLSAPFFLALVATLLLTPVATFTHFVQSTGSPPSVLVRDQSTIAERIRNTPGKHLVVIHYPEAAFPEEWVFNEANIDDSKVVWARSMGELRDNRLKAYFNNRQIWDVHFEEDANKKARILLYSDKY
jgi:hypothetical protein